MTPARTAKPDRRPPYQHAADELRREIKAGRFKPGEQLPSYRELQDRFGIASMTARSAVNVLRDEGLVYTVQGRGSFVADAPELAHDIPADYEAPAWYLASKRSEAPVGVPSGEVIPTEALTEILRSLRDEIRALSADHQQLKREVAELKAERQAAERE
ncbi:MULTISPECIES: GntR family transcriptional regulator [unclassified Streptomyces]|uniref:GntR family transcriptional regulator n=1 Tax=unclassified Streptomyces TaxID=2593676 RepID=UPI00380B32E0